MNLYETMLKTYDQHRNLPHAMIVGALKVDVHEHNKLHHMKLDPSKEVNDFFAIKARYNPEKVA